MIHITLLLRLMVPWAMLKETTNLITMKITITFTSALLNNFENLIFKTAIQDDWQKKWE